MIRFVLFLFSLLVLAACAPEGDSAADAAEWAEIQALADDAADAADGSEGAETVSAARADASEFAQYSALLEKMQTVERGGNEMLLTGETLTFDYEQRRIQLRGGVVVEDAEGVLETDELNGRFSAANEIDFIEAAGGVTMVSSNRTAQADHAVYNHRSGFVQLEGRAQAALGANRMSGERIQLWVGRGKRRMVCEPNALLEITSAEGLQFDGAANPGSMITEIRADKAVYEESERLAELTGNVRVRDPRAAMNCDRVRIFLEVGNEIDWIEASGEVIIQSDETRALAARATYQAAEGEFALEGDPMIKQGLHVLTGDRIRFWHETQRMVCEPNARALLFIPEDIKAKFLKDLDE